MIRNIPYRILAAKLALFHIWILVWPLLVTAVHAEESPLVTARPSVRRLKIIPFSNLSGTSNLDYLETGLPQMILNGMTLPVFIRDFRPPDVVLDPAGKASVNSPYSSPQITDDAIGSTREKILLEGEVYRWGINEGNLVEMESGFPVAASIDADYLIQGRIIGDRSNPVLELEFYDAIWGKKSSTVISLSGRNPYDEATLTQIRQFISSRLPGLGSGRLQVSTAKPGALVFLDDVYLGKSPLNEAVAPGSYELRVSHEECEDESRSIDLNQSSNFSFECRPVKGDATLVVNSDPPGAQVFLNVEFLGTTPLKVENLKEGTHRIRISLDNHIDRFKGVELKSGKTSTVSVTMSEGNTEDFYRDPGYVITDWTHHDLAFGFMLQSLVLGGGWAYSTIRANEVRDSIRSQIPALAITDVPSFSVYQFQQIENNRLDAKVWDNRANLFSGAAIASLVFAGVFLWLGYEHDDKEFGEVGLLQQELLRSTDSEFRFRENSPDSRDGLSDSGLRMKTLLVDVAFYAPGSALGPDNALEAKANSFQLPFSRNLRANGIYAPVEMQHRLGLRFIF